MQMWAENKYLNKTIKCYAITVRLVLGAEVADIVLCVILRGADQNFSEIVRPLIMAGSVVAYSNATAQTTHRV
jgi:hypothetical protein